MKTRKNNSELQNNARAYSANYKPSKSDVGLGNVDNVRQYSVNNPPPQYPHIRRYSGEEILQNLSYKVWALLAPAGTQTLFNIPSSILDDFYDGKIYQINIIMNYSSNGRSFSIPVSEGGIVDSSGSGTNWLGGDFIWNTGNVSSTISTVLRLVLNYQPGSRSKVQLVFNSSKAISVKIIEIQFLYDKPIT